MSEPERPEGQPAGDAVHAAISALLAPLARLAVSHGVPFMAVEGALRRAFVDVAREALLDAGLPAHRLVSRISTSTGLTRREVTRLTQLATDDAQPVNGSLAAEVFTRWVTDRNLRSPKGQVQPLPRTGDSPSFESIARSVTQDVHPRSLLEELCRLGMARLDEGTDTVMLLRDAFVPDGDRQHMLGFLADNVGDHLHGAVDNVLAQGSSPHFDQAVFADELSAESLQAVHSFIANQWQGLMAEAVPLLEQRIGLDRTSGRLQNKRVRIGLYSYEDDMRPSPQPAATPARAARQAKTKKGSDNE